MISNYYSYDFEKLDGSTNITKRMISKKIKISLTRKNYYFKVYTVDCFPQSPRNPAFFDDIMNEIDHTGCLAIV